MSILNQFIDIQLMNKFDLNEWGICNPDNREDILPQPYRLINEVLNQTILFKLNLAMYEIEEKKKDKNYEGTVKEYLSQSTIDIENIACFSSFSKTHNHLLAGDKSGNVYLLDLAKKIVFSKKELALAKRVLYISETFIGDGDISITTVAVVLNNHSKIYILRYKHSQPKLVLTHQIQVCADENDPNKLPYSCQLLDYGRMLFVYTYDGSIVLFRIPEVPIDLSQINKSQTIPLEQQQFKKKLRYPLTYSTLQSDVTKINDKLLQIKFQGKKIPLTKEQLLAKMAKKSEPPPVEVDTKKDPKKKEEKKVEQQQQPQIKEQIQLNPILKKGDPQIQNGNDNTIAYKLPKYRPFVYVVHSKVQLQKKKEFEKGRFIEIPERIIYGWTNTKQFRIGQILAKKANFYPNYIYIQHFLQKIPDKFAKDKQDYLSQKITIKNIKAYKNIYQISATNISSDQQYFACGLINGAITVWSTNTANVIYNTQKHKGAVTALHFFEGWKVISGSSKGEVQIDNIISLSNEVKRTNIFQSKVDYEIASIKVSDLGIAFVVDANGGLRVYDLWRNQKIAKVQSCNSFALLENRGKRWIPGTSITPSVALYTNNDFTAVLSSNWPSFSSRDIEESESKKKQVNGLIQNPWKCKGTNVHIIRNFQFLLTLFDGLQNTYKKGYQRKKIQNLFTNLEFTQLYDRNFEIPDFGVTNNGKKGQKNTEVGFGVGSKTHISNTKSKDKLKESSSASQMSRVKYKLTNEVLHPQKFLLERRKIEKQDVITDERLGASIRQIYKKQNALENALSADFSKNLL